RPAPSETYAAPAPEADSSNAATLIIRVPADAELWVQGVKMADTGPSRRFVSPALEPGEDYVYRVRARWTRDAGSADQTRNVDVHAGDRITVDFNKPPRQGQ